MLYRKYALPLAGAVGIGLIASSALAVGLVGGGHPGHTQAAAAAASSHKSPVTPGHGSPEGQTVVGGAAPSVPYVAPVVNGATPSPAPASASSAASTKGA